MDAIQQTTCNRRHARCNMRRRRSAGAAGDGAALLLTAGRVLRSLLLTRAVAHTLAAIRSARPCSHPCTLIILPPARPPMPGMLARLQKAAEGAAAMPCRCVGRDCCVSNVACCAVAGPSVYARRRAQHRALCGAVQVADAADPMAVTITVRQQVLIRGSAAGVPRECRGSTARAGRIVRWLEEVGHEYLPTTGGYAGATSIPSPPTFMPIRTAYP